VAKRNRKKEFLKARRLERGKKEDERGKKRD
jgi:hypothetical protein